MTTDPTTTPTAALSSRDAAALTGPWIAAMYTSGGGFLIDLDDVEDGDYIVIAVVRGTAAPRDGRMPGSYHACDVLYEVEDTHIDEDDPAGDIAARWAQAQAVARALNELAITDTDKEQALVARVRAKVAEEIAQRLIAEADDEAQRPNRGCCSHSIETWLRESADIARALNHLTADPTDPDPAVVAHVRAAAAAELVAKAGEIQALIDNPATPDTVMSGLIDIAEGIWQAIRIVDEPTWHRQHESDLRRILAGDPELENLLAGLCEPTIGQPITTDQRARSQEDSDG